MGAPKKNWTHPSKKSSTLLLCIENIYDFTDRLICIIHFLLLNLNTIHNSLRPRAFAVLTLLHYIIYNPFIIPISQDIANWLTLICMSRNSKRYGFSFVVWHLFKYNGVIIAIRMMWSTIIHSLKHIIFWSKDLTLILQHKFLRIKPILHSYIIALRIIYSK